MSILGQSALTTVSAGSADMLTVSAGSADMSMSYPIGTLSA